MSELVLVTGGAGFVGYHTCEALLAAGYRVRVLDNLSAGAHCSLWNEGGPQFMFGDIRDYDQCSQACDGADYVIHLAAMSRSGPSLNRIAMCTEVNVVGTENMLVAARNEGVKKFVYAGSATWYGDKRPEWVGNWGGLIEDTPPDFLNPYALSKGVGEQYTLACEKFYGLRTTVLRYFNVYGPRQPKEGAYALVLGIFLDRAAKGLPLEIHGEGDQRRDFVHVRDVARANILAIQEPHQPGDILNIGSGANVSVQELADMISQNQVHTDRRPGDAQETLADASAAWIALGWQARITLEEGLKELMNG